MMINDEAVIAAVLVGNPLRVTSLGSSRRRPPLVEDRSQPL